MKKNGQKWVHLIQMNIVSTTVHKNPLEDMEQLSQSTKESEMSQKWQNDLSSFPRQTIQHQYLMAESEE